VLAAVIVAVVVLATMGSRWPWTGFASNESLWSWLTLLAQPVALAVLTIRLVSGDRSWRMWRLAGAACGVALAALAACSYALGWSWTGFGPQRLWDWLHLLLFPVVLVLLPEWIRAGASLPPAGRLAALAGTAGFAVVVIGGYHWNWRWTGFTGNTLRDWFDLLVAPFLLPAALKAVYARHGVRLAGGRLAD
jgi:hypothetical protein